MRFLANENFPLNSVFILRAAGHDVVAIAERSPGLKDEEVLRLASREQRIILTFDRDYGEMIYRLKSIVPPGLIYFRFIPATPQEPAELVLELLEIKDITLEGKFTVLERGRVRQRSLPLSGMSD